MTKLYATLIAGLLSLLAVLIVPVPGLRTHNSGTISSAWAAETAVKPVGFDAFLDRLQAHYQATNSFSADFTQTLTRVGAPPRERQGTVAFQKPGRVRFEFGGNQPETVVSDGTRLYDYDPGLNQVTEMPIKQAVKAQAVAAFLMGVGNLRRDFNPAPAVHPSSATLTYIELTPKTGGDRVELGVNPATFNIERLKMTDALGNVAVFEFSRIRTNLSLPASLFAFAIPPGADVISPNDNH